MSIMVANGRREHWDTVYRTKRETGLSWYQADPRLSLELLADALPAAGGRVIDVGGGASTLVDRLLDLPVDRIAVLDISATALAIARARLGTRAQRVEWIVADVTADLELGAFDVWHDRAVFHFLTHPDDRSRYIELARRTLPAGGHLIMATFADDGPTRCSDLDVCRYNAETTGAELGSGFSLVRATRETHATPWGSSQVFFYGVFRRT
jgi:SAM-dependent methyltransferase